MKYARYFFTSRLVSLCLFLAFAGLFASCGSHNGKDKNGKAFIRPDETDPIKEFAIDTSARADCMEVLPNGNIVVISSNNVEILIASYTQEGKIVWQQKVTIPGDTIYANCSAQTTDGNIVIGGDVGFGDKQKGWIGALDVNGKILWQKTLPCNNVKKITRASNGDLVLAINTSGLDVMRIKPDGTVLWQNMYGEASVYITCNIFSLKDNGTLLCGYGGMDSTGQQQLELNYIKSDGSTQWTKKYRNKGLDMESPLAIYEDAGGNIHMWGECTDTGVLKEGVRYVKLDVNGNIIAEKNTFWDDDASLCKAAIADKDGRIYIVGTLENFRVSYRMFLACGDTTGNLLWTRSVGKDQCLRGGDDVAVLNGHVITLGYKCDGSYVSLFTTDGGKAVKSNY